MIIFSKEGIKTTQIMKTKIWSITLLTFSLCVGSLKAQDDVGSLISSNIEDSKVLFKGYFEPFGKAFGSALNGGWYNTARPHKLGRFDFGLNTSIVNIPTADQSFIVQNLSNIRLVNPNDNVSPTIFGSDTEGPALEVFVENPVDGTEYVVGEVNMPQGSGINTLPVPIPQLAIGLPQGTEIMLRYLPTISAPNDDVEAKLDFWGVGFKHSLKQWINEDMPFDLSIMAGYTRLSLLTELEILPDENARPSDASLDDPNFYNNQQLEYDVSAFTTNLIISKKLSILTLYGSIGMGQANTSLRLKGNFPVTVAEANGGNVETVIMDFVDPIDISTGDVSGVRTSVGMRLKLLILTIHADYTIAEYNMFTAGVGFNFDWGGNSRGGYF